MPSNKCNKPSPVNTKLRNQFKSVVGVVCLDVVFSKGQMSVAKQHELVFNLFHGNKGEKIASKLNQLVKGESFFKRLYEDVTQEVVDGSQPKQPSRLKLKSVMSHDKKIYFAGEDITVKSLERVTANSATLCPGRNIADCVKNHQCD